MGGDEILPAVLVSAQRLCADVPKAEKPEDQEQADKRPMIPQPADSTGLTPALKKLKMPPDHGDLAKNIKKLQLSDQENNKKEGTEVPKQKRDSPKKKSKAKTSTSSDKEEQGGESPGKEKAKSVGSPVKEKPKEVKIVKKD